MANLNETPPATPTDRRELQRSFASVFADIDTFLAEANEEKREERGEQFSPLCIMRKVVYTIQLAWGGPEYGFKLEYDPQAQEWTSGRFYHADWFTFDELALSPAELEKVVEVYAMDSLVEP